jgi:hypothetical protein
MFCNHCRKATTAAKGGCHEQKNPQDNQSTRHHASAGCILYADAQRDVGSAKTQT